MSSSKECTNCYKTIRQGEFSNAVQDEGKAWNYCTLCQPAYEAHLKEIDNPDRYEGKEKVRVIGIPVRCNHRRYFESEEVHIETDFFDENLFERI